MTWSQLLRAQAAVACDFATIDTAPLRRFSLLFFDVTTREVILAGITTNPTSAWTVQAARNLFLMHVGDPATVWTDAAGHEHHRGSQIAETTVDFADRQLRLVVRRQPVGADGDAQLSIDDLDGWRFHAIITNVPSDRTAVDVEAHHRARGGVPEDAIRSLKEGFGFDHAPLGAFFGNWLWQQAAALAHNTSVWLRRLALPEPFQRIRTKRLRLTLLNVAARVGTHARRIQLRFARGYRSAHAIASAIERLHALPAFT